MKCPYCGCIDSKVIDSRPTEESSSIRRRRECISCQKRFTTYESIETLPIMVIKKDGKREIFDRNKLLSGIIKACEKRPIALGELELMAADIEQVIRNSLEREITTSQIGELVMERLKKIDEVAYVRFASVYRQFRDINTFMEELNNLLRDRPAGEK